MHRNTRIPGLAMALLVALVAPVLSWTLGQPHMSVDPLDLDFPPRYLGATGDIQWFEIQNAPGGSDLSFSVTLQGANANDFQLSCSGGGSSCLSGFILPGQSRIVQVSFAPNDPGLRLAEVVVSGTDSTNPSDTVVLEGYGVDPIFDDGFEIGDAGAWSSCSNCFS